MAETTQEAIKNFYNKRNGINTQQVFQRMPQAETKERQKVDFNALFDSHAKKICKEPYQENKVVRTLKNYFLRNPNFNQESVLNEPSLEKGLLVFGTFGVGKSMFFKIIHSMAKELVMNHGYQGLYFSQISAPSFVNEHMASTKQGYGGNFHLESYYKGKLYIDDLGAEPLCFNKHELFEDVLFERHRNDAMTFITTNLTPSQIGDKYGARIGDRLPEMFNIIKWDGKSFRE